MTLCAAQLLFPKSCRLQQLLFIMKTQPKINIIMLRK